MQYGCGDVKLEILEEILLARENECVCVERVILHSLSGEVS